MSISPRVAVNGSEDSTRSEVIINQVVGRQRTFAPAMNRCALANSGNAWWRPRTIWSGVTGAGPTAAGVLAVMTRLAPNSLPTVRWVRAAVLIAILHQHERLAVQWRNSQRGHVDPLGRSYVVQHISALEIERPADEHNDGSVVVIVHRRTQVGGHVYRG